MDGRPAQGQPGLTLRVVIEDAKWFSAQASTNARFLAAGGLAVVWALAEGKVANLRAPYMTGAVLGFVLALLLDFVHYADAATRCFRVIGRNRAARTPYDEPAIASDEDFPATKWFTRKLWLLVIAYAVLGFAFVMKVFPEMRGAVRWLAALVTK